MGEFLCYVVIVALLSAFALTLLRKWGIIEWLQVHGNNLISKLANCDFCLSFWSGLIISLLFIVIVGDLELALIPFCSTMITRNLL